MMPRVLVHPMLITHEYPAPAIFDGAGNPNNRHTHNHYAGLLERRPEEAWAACPGQRH